MFSTTSQILFGAITSFAIIFNSHAYSSELNPPHFTEKLPKFETDSTVGKAVQLNPLNDAVSLNVSDVSTPLYVADSATERQKQADQLREEGESLKAIDLYNHAIVGHQANKDYARITEAMTGRLLSWKHLFYRTDDKIYAIFVKKEAEEILEIVKEHQLFDRLHLVHFLYGTAAILLKDYSVAEKAFGQAVELYPRNHAEKGDWIAHLGEAVYRNGKKEEGKNLILQGVQIIQENTFQIDSFLYNVWVSGAYLRLAKFLQFDNIEEGRAYLTKAKNIINSDDRLVIRKQQLIAATECFGSM